MSLYTVYLLRFFSFVTLGVVFSLAGGAGSGVFSPDLGTPGLLRLATLSKSDCLLGSSFLLLSCFDFAFLVGIELDSVPNANRIELFVSHFSENGEFANLVFRMHVFLTR